LLPLSPAAGLPPAPAAPNADAPAAALLEPAAALELPEPPLGALPLGLDELEQAIDEAVRLRKKMFRNCVARARPIEAPSFG
jgi:hypothetical protein